MKITRLKLTGWRSHQATDIPLERLSVIRGRNHEGKSGVGQGIEFALTGRCDATNRKGEGAAWLIQDYDGDGSDKAAKALIELDLTANKPIHLRCSLTPSSGRNLTITDPADKDYDNGANVQHWLAAQRDVLSCLLNTRYFVAMDPAEQKDLLSGIILPDSYDWPQEWRDLAASAGWKAQDPSWAAPPFEVIEAVYTYVYGDRRDLSRDLKNTPLPAEPPAAAEDPEALRTELSNLRTSLYERERQWREHTKTRANVAAQISGLEQRVESLTAKIRTEEETRSQIAGAVLSEGQLKARSKTAANAKELLRLNQEKVASDKRITELRALLAQFDVLGMASECPTCHQVVSDEFLMAAMKPHKDGLDKALRAEKDLIDSIKACGDVEGAQRAIEAHESAKERVKRCDSIISETSGVLKTTEKELADLRDSLPVEAAEDPQFTADRKRLPELERKLEQVAADAQRVKDYQKALESRQAMAKKLADLERLVGYFGPNGVKATLLKENISQFEAAMNAALEAWGYRCELQMEPYGFYVWQKDGKRRRLKTLSESERFQFAIAFQVALAMTTDIKLVVIDGADLFDEAGRGALFPLLLESGLDQAIIMQTDERMEAPALDGMVVYSFRDGKAVRLEAKA